MLINNKSDEEENKTCLAVGGQALIEGVMMKGVNVVGIAVRTLDGNIVKKVEPINSKVKKYKLDKIPFVRGIFNFGSSMIIGTKALMFSAQLFDIEETEEEKQKREEKETKKKDSKEKKVKTEEEKAKSEEKLKNIVIWFSVVVGILFSAGLFIVLPNLLSFFIVPEDNIKLYNFLEAVLKFTIFFIYLVLVSQMKDIQRVFEYHGAEHKTIACYENNLELTVENIKKQTRFHPRCGTNFMIIVLIISVIIFCLIGRYDNWLINIGYRLLLLPIVAGIAYELIRLVGKTKNRALKLIAFPGLWLQRLTTKEPDDSQIEVAIEALKLAVETERVEFNGKNQ